MYDDPYDLRSNRRASPHRNSRDLWSDMNDAREPTILGGAAQGRLALALIIVCLGIAAAVFLV